MANAAAGVLALSLIVAGLSILGEVLGYWKLPSDIWGAVILLLGTAGRWASTRIPGRSGSRELGATNGDKSQQKPPPPAALILLLLLPVADGCGGPQVRADAAAWARCAGGGALMCIPAAGFEDPERAALAYAGCVAKSSIGCVAPLVARGNPPTAPPEAVEETVDLGCVQDVAAGCLPAARIDNELLTRYDSQECVRARLAPCWRGGSGP